MQMNLREFTETVDRETKEMSREELWLLVHSLVRKMPEEAREEFLGLIGRVREKEAEDGGSTNDINILARERDRKDIHELLTRLEGQFHEIREGTLALQADGYEDYSSGYWDPDWVYEYEDPEGIGEIFEQADKLIQRCVNDGYYEEAVTLFDLTVETEVYANDGDDGIFLGLRDLVGEQLASVDCERLIACGLYAVYQNTEPDKRAQELYNYLNSTFFSGTRLEAILSVGREELEGQEMFWKSWIRLLSDKPGDTAGRYLEEAVLFQCTEEEMIETAHKAASLHPGLYLAVIEKLAENDAACALDTGRTALKEVDVTYKIRGSIALATAEAALKMDERKLAEQCWLEAFRSDTTAVNYLRIAAECEEPELYRKELMQAIHSCRAFSNDGGSGNNDYGNRYETYRETSRNSVDDRERFLLCFLSGDFDAAMEKCAEVQTGLGWTGRAIKCGIPLFLLLLLQSGTLSVGCREQLRTVAFEMGFQKKDYEKGLYREAGSQEKSVVHEDADILEEVFLKWKARQVISADQAEKYLVQLNRLIHMRVKAIVSGQHRGHYGSVAALAAALGEVKESRGELSAKARILLDYRAEFPKHSSFHAQLRAYGMPDTRKR